MKPPKLSLLLSTSSDRRFCTLDGSPWCHHPGQKLLARQTYGCPVLIGRRTFERLPHPLPNAYWIVLSHTLTRNTFGVWTVRTAQEALIACRNALEIFVLGGVSLFDMFMPLASSIYWLEVLEPAPLDVRKFPALDEGVWKGRVMAESSQYVLRKHTREFF